MKNYCFLLTLLITLSNAHANDCETVNVTGRAAYYPLEYIKDREMHGAGPKILAKMLDGTGLLIDSKVVPNYKRANQFLKDGIADITTAVYPTDELATYLDFVEPYYTKDQTAIITQKGKEFPFEKWEDLKGKRGVMIRGESCGSKELDKILFEVLKVKEIASPEIGFKFLRFDRADYAVMHRGIIADISKEMIDDISILDKPLTSAKVYFAVSKTSPCRDKLVSIIQEKLPTLIENETVVETINDEYVKWLYGSS